MADRSSSVIRLEWLHARAAVDRWREECILLREEARRSVAGFMKDSKLWAEKKVIEEAAAGKAKSSVEGYNAFVAKQAWVYQTIANNARAKLLEALAPLPEP